MGLREDKPAELVVREDTTRAAASGSRRRRRAGELRDTEAATLMIVSKSHELGDSRWSTVAS